MIEDYLIIKKYLELFSNFSIHNEFPARLSFHCILGALLKDDFRIPMGGIYLDCRFPVAWLQTQRTGKSVAYEFIKKISDASGLVAKEVDKTSSEAWIGTVDKEEVVDKETKSKKNIYFLVTGILNEQVDIIHYDEMSLLFNKNKQNEDTIPYLQKVLAPIGSETNSLSKKLVRGPPIEIKPLKHSFWFTSYPLRNLQDYITFTGFFQRMVFYNRIVEMDEREQMEQERLNRIGKDVECLPEIEKLGKELQKMVVEAKMRGKLEFDKDVIPFSKVKQKSYYDMIRPTNLDIKEIAASFLPNLTNYLLILAVHSAVIRGSKKVEKQDIEYAHEKIIYPLLQELVKWIESEIMVTKKRRAESKYETMLYQIYNKIKSEGWAVKSNLINSAVKDLQVSKPTIYAQIKEWQEETREGIRYIRPKEETIKW